MPWLLSIFLLAVTPSARQQGSRIGIHPPKLVVLFSVDQFRADYIERYNQYFLPAHSGGKIGGFRFLMETGANFRDAVHNHLPTATGPGHATLMTGSEPAFDGIVSNDWFNRVTGKTMYVVDDPSCVPVGSKDSPMSPRNLLVTTVGDELKMATNGRSKVVGIAIKDRAAILMAGHAADTVIWYDRTSANWETSSWYAPSLQLPDWVQKLNDERQVDKFAGKVWEPLLPTDGYVVTRPAPGQKASPDGKAFSHEIGRVPGKALYSEMITSQYGNEFTFSAITHAIDGERLGQHDVPDILVVNLSSNDYVGHRYGPNSPEVMDITVRTDRLLSDFFNVLQHKIDGGIDSVAIVLTGDHGIVPIPEESHEVYKTGAARGAGKIAIAAIEEALTSKYGAGKWILGSGIYEQNLYLNRALASEKKLKMTDVEQVAADAGMKVPGVFETFTRTQIMSGAVPHYPWIDRVTNGFNLKLGGDIFILQSPGDLLEDGAGTDHGSVWDYDAHVPLLIRARGVKPGLYMSRVHTSDIAPTLCQLLGIEYPSGNVGRPLSEALSH